MAELSDKALQGIAVVSEMLDPEAAENLRRFAESGHLVRTCHRRRSKWLMRTIGVTPTA